MLRRPLKRLSDRRLHTLSPLSPFVPLHTHLCKIHAKRVHVQPVEEARKALAEPRQAVVHDLHVPHVRLERRHRVRQLREHGLKRVQREGLVGARVQGAAGGAPERGRGARGRPGGGGGLGEGEVDGGG